MKLRAALLACTFPLLAVTALAQQYTWTTVAGLPPQFGSADGAATDSRYYNPNSLVADSAGHLYVTDTFNHTIRKIAPNGSSTTIAGSVGVTGTVDGTGSAARFNSPNGIVLDSTGTLYVADRGNHAIRKITPAGVVTTFAGQLGTSGTADGPAADARFNRPSGLLLDRDGDLWITEVGNHTVRRIATDGTVTTVAGLAGTSGSTDGTGSAARFLTPAGIAQETSGDLIVADAGNHTLRRLTRDGVVTTWAGSPGVRGPTSGAATVARFNFPTGLAFDDSGNLYVADALNDCIRRVTSAGVVSVFAGSADVRGSSNGTGTTARFYSPFGIARSPAGDFYIADTLNHTIRKLTATQIATNHSGPGGGFGNIDGTGAAARFNYPHGLALDAENNAYVADWRNGAVRKVTPAAEVTTHLTLANPYGISFGGGLIAVSNRTNHIVRLFSSATTSVFSDIGTSGRTGSTDGPYTSALFNQPQGILATTTAVYVADTGNHTIRAIFAPAGGGGLSVTTVAGAAGLSGATNGPAASARFSSPGGLALDRAGNLYVADTGSHTIRKITPTGVVSTFAGTAFSSGTASGASTVARFSGPEGLAADTAGNIFVADRGNNAIRRISPDGFVITVGGLPGFSGYAEGTGLSARFLEPVGLALDSRGAIYVVSAGNNILMRGVLDTTPAIATHPQSTVIAIGTSTTLAVSATGGGLSYQWKYEGTAIAGATASSYTLASAQASQTGHYTVDVSNSAGLTTSSGALVSVQATVEVSRIVNLAIRSQAGTDAQTLIVGVGVGGVGTTGHQPILIRGIGPTLGAFGVAGVLTDPRLEVYLSGTKINENDNWSGNAQIATIGGQVGAFGLSNASSRDAALYLPSLAAGSYSVQITGGTGGGGAPTGIALAEVYDATPAASRTPTTPRLTNVSARTQVGVEGDVLIAGFVIAGQTTKTVLLRAIGPTLGSFGVTGVLADPKLELFGPTGKITENDNWGGVAQLSTTFFAVGAFPLAAASRDAVLLVHLAPGNYTAQISGVNATTGVALVEVYEVP